MFLSLVDYFSNSSFILFPGLSYCNTWSISVRKSSKFPIDLQKVKMGQHSKLIMPWGGKNTQKNCTKTDLHDPDNHNGVITDLEPDILECEVKWALESITTNKASGGDGIPVELFQILKDDAVKVLHSICQQIWKLSSGHRTGKGQFSFQSQRKAMPKNAQTTSQLHSSHTLVK